MFDTKNWLPTEKEVENFILLCDLLSTQKMEFDLLSKRKPDVSLNKMKIKIINRVLEPLKKILAKQESNEFLDTLQEDDIPTNSDIVLIISQYMTAVTNFRDRYYLKDKYQFDNYNRNIIRWMTKEKPFEFYASGDEEDE